MTKKTQSVRRLCCKLDEQSGKIGSVVEKRARTPEAKS